MNQNPITKKPEVTSLTHDYQGDQSLPKSRVLPKKILKNKMFTTAVVLVAIIAASAIFIWPKAQTVKFASSARESVSSLFTEMDSVDSSLNALFKYATHSDDSDVQLSKLNQSFKKLDAILATLNTAESNEGPKEGSEIGLQLNSFLKDLSRMVGKLEISERGDLSFGGSVKGFTTPEDDPNKIYRDQRDLATKVISSIEDSEKSIEKLEQDLERKGTPNSLNTTKQDLKDFKTKAEDYLSESGKTADYYVKISELSIELESGFDSFQVALNSATDVNSLVKTFDDISKELKSLRTDLASIKKEDLPLEIDDLHEDTLELFDISINFFDKMKVLTLNGDTKGMSAILIETDSKLNQLIISGTDNEMSFWKNNKVLNSYGSINEDHTKLLKNLEQEKDKNNIFVLKYFGID